MLNSLYKWHTFTADLQPELQDQLLQPSFHYNLSIAKKKKNLSPVFKENGKIQYLDGFFLEAY